MDYNLETIKKLIPQFIRTHHSYISFFKKGKEINVKDFSGINVINLTKGNYDDDFNFEAIITIKEIQIESLRCQMKGSLTLKVGYDSNIDGVSQKEPQEFIVEIKNSRINLLE